MGPQLPLSVQLPDATSFENFHAGPNESAAAAVQALAKGTPPAPGLLLHGIAGSGKTHLLQAAVRAAAADGAVAYLPFAELGEPSAAMLEGLDQARLVALDDIDHVAIYRGFAVSLLRLLDSLRARGAAYLVASAQPAERMPAAMLPDLRTRLGACAHFVLQPLGDADLALLLQNRAQRRGLELPAEVAEFLLRRLPRHIPALLDALKILDRATLSAQRRRLTIPFVTQALPALAPTIARTARD